MTTKIVNQAEFDAAHEEFLKLEKELTRKRDELSRMRRQLPRVEITKPYSFFGEEGKRSLGDLFAEKSQLIVQHFMLGPNWEAGCQGCSFMADHIDGYPLKHLGQRDVRFVAVSRAPWEQIKKYQMRMGWKFPWYSSSESDFNVDFKVSFTQTDKERGTVRYNYSTIPFAGEELPGMSVFFRDAQGRIFHTYSTFARGNEQVMGTYSLLDMLPMGRAEEPFKDHPMEWVKRHDEYDSISGGNCCH